MMHALALCSIGAIVGYFYGLSLVKQGKACSFSFIMPLFRFTALATLSLLLLQWGTIPFILFVSSFIAALWTAILTNTE